MKNILFILSILISTTVYSKTAEELKIRDVRVQKQNENVLVNFTLEVPRHAVKSKYKQILIPVVYSQRQEIRLPGIEVTGRNKARRDKQVRLLTGIPETASDRMTVRDGETVSYEAAIPYETWMETLSLRVDREETGCCEEKALAALQLAEGIQVNPTPPAPVTPAPVVSVPETISKQQFTIYFRFNRADIDTNYMNNIRVLDEVSEFLKQDGSGKAQIEIMGYASPEGNEKWNEKLAYRRAEALQNYLVSRGWTKQSSIAIVRHAINWEELKDLVSKSDMPYKTDVLEILNDTTNAELTNQKLQRLQGGVPYRHLVTKVYPKLRVASFLITNFNN